MFVILFFLLVSSTNKRMTDVDETPPSSNACSCLPAFLNGYPTFVTSIIFIGIFTAVIGDVAGHLGCFIHLKDGVNAIAFVALGTSVPGTYHQ